MGRKVEINVEEAAKMTHTEAQSIRIGLRQKRFEWGDSFQKSEGSRWSYIIYPVAFYRKLGFDKGIETREGREKIKQFLLNS